MKFAAAANIVPNFGTRIATDYSTLPNRNGENNYN
jgi:hypothetical protein